LTHRICKNCSVQNVFSEPVFLKKSKLTGNTKKELRSLPLRRQGSSPETDGVGSDSPAAKSPVGLFDRFSNGTSRQRECADSQAKRKQCSLCNSSKRHCASSSDRPKNAVGSGIDDAEKTSARSEAPSGPNSPGFCREFPSLAHTQRQRRMGRSPFPAGKSGQKASPPPPYRFYPFFTPIITLSST